MAEKRGFLQPGNVVAGFQIIRLIGSGGMGQVYLAQHPRLPRQDALKVLFPHLVEDDSFRARFHREASLAAQLSHPNIVAVNDTGEDNGILWLSMQYVDGIDAARLVQHYPQGVPPFQAVDIIAQAGRGLDRAHSQGMLHRDVKPANLLITGDWEHDDPHSHQVLVSDFGIARTLANSINLTGTGSILATISYAAPEILRAEPVDHRADIYALGCTLHQLLTGAVPFPRPDTAAAMLAHITEPPPQPATLRPELPLALNEVIATAMAKNPADRFESCKALTLAAQSALAGTAWSPPPAVMPNSAATTSHSQPARSYAPPTVAGAGFAHGSIPPPPPPPPQRKRVAASANPGSPPQQRTGGTSRAGGGSGAPATQSPAKKSPDKSGGNGKIIGIGLAAVFLAIIGAGVWYTLDRRGDDAGSSGDTAAEVTDDSGSEYTDTETTVAADEECTDAIMANTRWACINRAYMRDGELVIEYDGEWAGEEPNINGRYHLHVWGAQDGENPAVDTMGVPGGGNWLIKDVTPIVLTPDEVSTYIGDNPKVCIRIANGQHELQYDNEGGLATGNCWTIEQEY